MRAARDRYFADNGFGPDGGYGKPWVDFKFGRVPFPFPNTPARVAAVRFHDLHHVLTGYGTDLTGEFEISAWEIGAGCKRSWFAWQINLGGLGAGMLTAPRATARAFSRGLASDSLYGVEYESLLDERVDAVRARLRLDRPVAPLSTIGRLGLAFATVAGLVWGVVQLAVLLPLTPIGVLAGMRAKRHAHQLGHGERAQRPSRPRGHHRLTEIRRAHAAGQRRSSTEHDQATRRR
jgi:hypothetical protein